MKEKTGNFLCPRCGDKLFGANHKVALVNWISREINGVKKVIVYGEDNNDYPKLYWYGKVEEELVPSDTDSEDSCGVKRHIHISSYTNYRWIKSESPEQCWKQALTVNEWDKYIHINCWKCKYKSNFINFIQ